MEKVDDKKDKEERTEEKITKRPHLTDAVFHCCFHLSYKTVYLFMLSIQ